MSLHVCAHVHVCVLVLGSLGPWVLGPFGAWVLRSFGPWALRSLILCILRRRSDAPTTTFTRNAFLFVESSAPENRLTCVDTIHLPAYPWPVCPWNTLAWRMLALFWQRPWDGNDHGYGWESNTYPDVPIITLSYAEDLRTPKLFEEARRDYAVSILIVSHCKQDAGKHGNSIDLPAHLHKTGKNDETYTIPVDAV